jgi:hypothetical protein
MRRFLSENDPFQVAFLRKVLKSAGRRKNLMVKSDRKR